VFTSLTTHICYWNRKPYQNVNRWFTTVVNQPQFKAVVGDFKLCEKMAEFDPKKFAEFQGMLFLSIV
jgi:elongation factor 1-gamma